MLGHSPAVVHAGGGCDAGEPREEPLFLPPRRAIGYGTGPNSQLYRLFLCVFTFCTTTTIVLLNSTICQGPVHDLVNFRDLLRNKGRGQ